MKKSKKGLIIEALMRIIIMVVLVVVVFKIGERVVGAFSGSEVPNSIQDFVAQMNGLKDGEIKQSFLILDPGTAIVGFNKDGQFKCNICFQLKYREGELYKTFVANKPDNSECVGKSCVCACMQGFKDVPIDETNSRLECQKYVCTALGLNVEIAPKISLEETFKITNTKKDSYPTWENGFMFMRSEGQSTPTNGAPLNTDRKISVSIESGPINGKTYYAACPIGPCIKK